MRRAMLLALRPSLRHARPARPRLTATYRQRVGASDEARLALKEYSEFGQEPIPENTSEEDVALTGDAAVVRRAVGILAPYVSDERRDTFQRVVQQRTRHLSVAFERPSNPSNVWACLRTIDAFGCQDVHIVEIRSRRPQNEPRQGVCTPTRRMRGRKKRMTSAMGGRSGCRSGAW